MGVIFPVFIMALVPFRQYIMPRFFKREHLRELDAAPYEEVRQHVPRLVLPDTEFQAFVQTERVAAWVACAAA